MKDQLASQDELISYEELISLSLHIDNKLRERKQERNYSFHWPSLHVFLATTPVVLLLVQPPVPTAPIESGEPEDEPMHIGPYLLLSEERHRHCRSHSCFYCGTSNHLVSSWPKKGKGAICQ